MDGDGEIIGSQEPSESECEGLQNNLSDYLNDSFAYYLAIGMPASEYWHGDPDLVKGYRKADEIRTKRRNYELWLQGMYVYEAISDISPLLHAFAKKGTMAKPYPDKPYPITKKEIQERKKEEEKRQYEQTKAAIHAMMIGVNKKFENKKMKDKEVR